MSSLWSRRNGSHKINPLGPSGAPQPQTAAAPSPLLPPLPRPPSPQEEVDLEAGDGTAPRPYHPLRLWPHAKEERGPTPAAKAARAREERSLDEEEGLLGESVVNGMLAPAPRDWLKPFPPKPAKGRLPPPRRAERRGAQRSAQLGGGAFTWGDNKLLLKEILAVSCCEGSRLITIHAYPWRHGCLAPCVRRRVSTKLSLLAPSPAEALMWASAFADRRCHVSMHTSAAPRALTPTPGDLATAGRPVSPLRPSASVAAALSPPLRLRPCPVVAVIINPRSGRGRALRVFGTVVRPMLELAGFKLTVMETAAPSHAVKLAASLSLATCPDGIICIGGDGIVNEVLNGLYSREDSAEALALPIGVVPAGSDNSLVWSVLGISDPVSACLAIVKGRTIQVDAILVRWEGDGTAHVGLNIAYFGFMSDVLELSGRYQTRFGPLRYVIAGAQRLLRLPSFHFDVEYLPYDSDEAADRVAAGCAGPAALSAHESSAEPTERPCFRTSSSSPHLAAEEGAAARGRDDACLEAAPSPEPGFHSGRRSPDVCTPAGSGVQTAVQQLSPSNTLGEDAATPVARDRDAAADRTPLESARSGPQWVLRRGPFLAIMVCNHGCKSVQCLESQALAPLGDAADGCLDLLMCRKVGRLQLLRFLILLQFGCHISLPYVEYTKVKAVRITPGQNRHKGCGIDGELLPVHEPVMASVLHNGCCLMGGTHSGP